MRKLFSVCCAVWLGLGWAGAVRAGAPSVSVYALQYGTSWFPTRYMMARKSKHRVVRFSWLLYVVRFRPAPGQKERVLLFDTGMTQKRYLRRWGLRHVRSPVALLKSLGLTPSDVTDVVLSHDHVDHAGGAYLFPRARFVMHPYTWRRLKQSRVMPRVRRVVRMAKKKGRVTLVKRALTLGPGLRCVWVGGHTVGSLVMALQTKRSKMLFVGDECYTQQACQKRWHLPGRSAHHIGRNRRFLRRFWSGKRGLWVPLTGHDPRIPLKGKRIAPGVFQIL